MKQINQIPTHKPNPKRPITLIIISTLSLLFSLAIIHNYFLYQSYIQGSCTITSASVIAQSHSKSAETYSPYYEFTVYTIGGQPYPTASYFGEYNTPDEANSALTQYTVGNTYQCWYNPTDPTHAGLTHAPYPFGLALLFTLLVFIGYFLGVGLVLLFAVYLLYPTFYLLRRGQEATGTFVDYVGTGRSRQARIAYSIEGKTYELKTSASTPIGKTVTVLFDPRGKTKSIIRSGAYWNFFLMLPLTLFLLGTVLYFAFWSWFLTT